MAMTSQRAKILTLDVGAINALANARRELKGTCKVPAYRLTKPMQQHVHWVPGTNFTKVIDREGKVWSTREWKRDIWPALIVERRLQTVYEKRALEDSLRFATYMITYTELEDKVEVNLRYKNLQFPELSVLIQTFTVNNMEEVGMVHALLQLLVVKYGLTSEWAKAEAYNFKQIYRAIRGN